MEKSKFFIVKYIPLFLFESLLPSTFISIWYYEQFAEAEREDLKIREYCSIQYTSSCSIQYTSSSSIHKPIAAVYSKL